MAKVQWGLGLVHPDVAQRAQEQADRSAQIRREIWMSDVLEHGQFELKRAKRCADCSDVIARGAPASYSDTNEIVCGSCYWNYQ